MCLLRCRLSLVHLLDSSVGIFEDCGQSIRRDGLDTGLTNENGNERLSQFNCQFLIGFCIHGNHLPSYHQYTTGRAAVGSLF